MESDIKMFAEKAKMVRKKVLEMLFRIDQGHPGSIFSMVELAVALYYSNLTTLGEKIDKVERDKLIISKGHATHTVYPILEDLGVIEAGSCDLFGSENHNKGVLRVFGNIKINGVDATSGSLGHGVGIGSGYALADKLDGKKHRTYVILSEGELYEGSIWEAVLFAAHHSLENLTVVLDHNHNIIMGDPEKLVKLQPIEKKFEAFGWFVDKINGHDFSEITNSIEKCKKNSVPQIIIAETVKGKGSKIMENDPTWHYWQSNKAKDLSLEF